MSDEFCDKLRFREILYHHRCQAMHKQCMGSGPLWLFSMQMPCPPNTTLAAAAAILGAGKPTTIQHTSFSSS